VVAVRQAAGPDARGGQRVIVVRQAAGPDARGGQRVVVVRQAAGPDAGGRAILPSYVRLGISLVNVNVPPSAHLYTGHSEYI